MDFTLIDGDRPVEVQAQVDGDAVRVAPEALRHALGWRLEPQGLCRGEVCVPLRDRSSLLVDGGIDLAAFAAALGRPLALEVAERVAALAVSAADRRAQLATLEAPDFALPDLAGRLHRLSDHRGKKALLIVYASW